MDVDPAVLMLLAQGRYLSTKVAPYFSAAVLALVPRPCPGLGTVGTTKTGILLYDPAFVAKQTPQRMAGLYLHEAQHLILRHHARRGSRDPRLFNYAGDLAINPGILELGLELPENGYFPEKFGFERGLTADEYYELLKRGAQPADGKAGGEAGEGEEVGEKPAAGAGWCGSCAGRPVPNEPDDSDPDGRSEAEVERATRQVAEAIRDRVSKQAGTVPASWARWADAALTPPQIPWQKRLSKVVRDAASWASGAVQHRYDAPGRRQAGIGYGAGKPVLPRLRRPVPRVAVAVDTSGSMGPAELIAAVSEIGGILKATNAEVDFVACDCAVTAIGSVRTVEEAKRLLVGGGGTDFGPMLAALAARRPAPDVAVVITDGWGPAPAAPPPRTKVIWVLTGENSRMPYGPGGADVGYGEAVKIPVGG